jgi:hypothetical protein
MSCFTFSSPSIGEPNKVDHNRPLTVPAVESREVLVNKRVPAVFQHLFHYCGIGICSDYAIDMPAGRKGAKKACQK